MTSLEADLQLLGSAEPELRLKLILLHRQAEKEHAERRHQAERERHQAEREQVAQRHQLELAKLQQQNRSAGPAEREGERVHRIPLDKFPAMDKDSDIDTFLQGFERTCRQYGVPREQWARYLTPGLRGKALEAFVSLPQEEETDFEAIKKAIIARYHLTPEVYRKRFRTVQRGPNDSYLDHACNLRTAFQQWLKGLSVETLDALKELMIKDQFLHTCPVEVRLFVLDREPKTVDEAAEMADSYTAHRAPESRRTTTSSWRGEQIAKPVSPSTQRRQAPLSPGFKQPDTRKCFVCDRVGHISTTCPEREREAPKSSEASNPSEVPTALCATRNATSYAENLQPVTVGDTVTTGLRDTGAEVTLVHPQLVNPEEYIPGKTMAVKGVGGVTPAIPTALVHLDWGAGSGLKEVGVTDKIPTNVLLGTDLGRLVARYEPTPNPVEPASPAEVLDSCKVLFDNAVQVGSAGEAPGAMDCVLGASPSESPVPRPGVGPVDTENAETDDVIYDARTIEAIDAGTVDDNCEVLSSNVCNDTDNVEVLCDVPNDNICRDDNADGICVVLHNAVCHVDTPSAAGVTSGARWAAADGLSTEGADGTRPDLSPSDGFKTKCDVIYDVCKVGTPSAAVVTRSASGSTAEGLSTEVANVAGSATSNSEPGPDGPGASPSAAFLECVTGSTELSGAVRFDSSLEELRGLASRSPAGR
ncbi:uncharacterized protein [Hyperolius riggenbachi]|uniref:uncharacterized protein n=1 Tax=Hyperolius riggenbachi TaxID=752182 RepID=UPI0035A32D03